MQDQRDFHEDDTNHHGNNTKGEKFELEYANCPNGSCIREDGTDSLFVTEDDVATVQLNSSHHTTMDTLMDLLKGEAAAYVNDCKMEEDDSDVHPYIHNDGRQNHYNDRETLNFNELDIENKADVQIANIARSSTLPVQENEITATALKENPVDIDLILQHPGRGGISDHSEDSFSGIDHPSSDFLWRTEILITFSRSCRGQVAYVVIDQEFTDDFPTEITVYVKCKDRQPTVFVSTFIKDERKVYSYSVFPCRNRKRWRYTWSADKAPTAVSFLVVEDANTTSRWETTTYEVIPTLPQYQMAPQSPIQLESDWVLVDCNERDIELFHEHQIEMSQSVNYQTLDKSCKVQ